MRGPLEERIRIAGIFFLMEKAQGGAFKISYFTGFTGDLVVNTLCSQCRGHEFVPWLGKILHAVWCTTPQKREATLVLCPQSTPNTQGTLATM